MLTLLAYVAEVEAQGDERGALEDALSRIDIEWEAPVTAAYRPGRWRDVATGANFVVDLGEPELTSMDAAADDPPTAYTGWRPLPLTIQIPLHGPHWLAVEALGAVERILLAAPWLRLLDSEDTREHDNADTGPFPFDKPRLILSWERQREAHLAGRSVPTLARSASVALWRYRKERAALQAAHPTISLPEANVLLDRATGEATSACVLPISSTTLLIPPVQILVAVGFGPTPQVIPADALKDRVELGPVGTAWIEPRPLQVVLEAHRQVDAVFPVGRFAALTDADWRD
jgi:hypothetical protein